MNRLSDSSLILTSQFRMRSIILMLTGVDKGGPAPPPMAGQKKFFVKIEGLLEPVVRLKLKL